MSEDICIKLSLSELPPVAGLLLNLLRSVGGTQQQSRLFINNEWQLSLAQAFESEGPVIHEIPTILKMHPNEAIANLNWENRDVNYVLMM